MQFQIQATKKPTPTLKSHQSNIEYADGSLSTSVSLSFSFAHSDSFSTRQCVALSVVFWVQMKWNETAYTSVGNSPVKTIFAIVAAFIKWIWTMRFARKVHKTKSNKRFIEMISLILPSCSLVAARIQCNIGSKSVLLVGKLSSCAGTRYYRMMRAFRSVSKAKQRLACQQNSNTGKKQDIVSDDVNNKFIQIIWRMKLFFLGLKFRMQAQPLIVVCMCLCSFNTVKM